MGNRILSLISNLFKAEPESIPESVKCKTCIISESYIQYLKEQLEYLQKELKSERDEYKRAVDRVLEIAGSRPVGQGETVKYAPAPPVDINKLMSLYEEQEEAPRVK